MNKAEVASKLKSAIAWYTDVTIEEHQTQQINHEADEAWELIEKCIKELVEAV